MWLGWKTEVQVIVMLFAGFTLVLGKGNQTLSEKGNRLTGEKESSLYTEDKAIAKNNEDKTMTPEEQRNLPAC